MSQLRLNFHASQIVKKIIKKPDLYGVKIYPTTQDTVIIDTGINANGGYLAGKALTEICLGGYGSVDLNIKQYGDLELPTIQVYTDHPAIATLGSQLAGWRIRFGEYQAIASGPARALALKPKKMYKKIGYTEKSDSAVLVLEASHIPDEQVIKLIADKCGVEMENLTIIVAPTASITGLTQISGRIVETAVHKFSEVGLNPQEIVYGFGYAPIAPYHPNSIEAMGRANDMLLYGGVAYLHIKSSVNEKQLRKMVEKIPSSASDDYGRPFADIFNSVAGDFYKIDSSLFAPAKVIVNDMISGKVMVVGCINTEILQRSIMEPRTL